MEPDESTGRSQIEGRTATPDLPEDKSTVSGAGHSRAGLARARMSLGELATDSLDFVDLSGATLHKANLASAQLLHGDLSGIAIRRTNLRGASIVDSELEGMTIDGIAVHEMMEAYRNSRRKPARPSWLPAYIPELQGLRGVAVLAVVAFHTGYLLKGTRLFDAVRWGWGGVNLFFVLSGFLITCILIEAQGKPHYFRNFYARRALRIWPVYILLLALCYSNAQWFLKDAPANQANWKTLVAYALFLQNLRLTPLPGPLVQTWSLAIEEQFYLVWAPLMRLFQNYRPRWPLPAVLLGMILVSVQLREGHRAWLTTNHTLVNLHGIAMGSLLALGLYELRWPRRAWLWMGFGLAAVGFGAAATVAVNTAALGAAVSMGCAGVVLVAIAGTGARNPMAHLLRRGPLAYCGKISYGIYMMHIFVFILLGPIEGKLGKLAHGEIRGNLAIFATRIVASALAATLLWYGFEMQILKLKRYFKTQPRAIHGSTG